ncbi:DUF4350 domain-containing protein [Erythrobacter ani]|uniref:DUF4350 domain-containing protein n=1 Tax=Erythrobacter ani TaxID=2827235 RepID=A0ABS6SMG5_9SPHN|nr:DUF4350 domain-containing protein [Erythrobacter ani]MBV7266031.1 DUF4350 domain-containing protein [Erythrobacter ani]
MTAPAQTGREASPFSRGTVLAVILIGFAAFLALLYFIGAGDTGERRGDGAAHGSAVGLNGYAGLTRLLEAEGAEVELSRSPGGLETSALLVLTPGFDADPDELGEMLERRRYMGPTLVILPKWQTAGPPRQISDEVAEEFKDGWVRFTGIPDLDWTQGLPAPFTLTRRTEPGAMWSGFGLAGDLSSELVAYAVPSGSHDPLMSDSQGRILAFHVIGQGDHNFAEDLHTVTVLVEPDIVNNYGLADATRAAAAIALVREAAGGDASTIVFDLTLNGLGGASNLLTLAFQPPFLAATLCLILASLIVGWRAFMRFGPVSAAPSEIAFGKDRLVRNGAGLIVRAKRFGLLAEPYAVLSQRRIAHALGINRPDPGTIDAAVAARLPDEEPYSHRLNRLIRAETAPEILHAAQAMKELEGKLTR